MKIKHTCGLLAALLLFALFAPLPTQAASEPLEWASVDKPGLEGNIVVTPSEVSEIAIGDKGVLYAIDSENSGIYRSLNAGVTWEDISSYLTDAGAELPASKIAVAPDKPGIVAVVTNDGTSAYLSTDGGATWTDTNVPNLTGTIQAIAISKEYTEAGKSVREIAVGTAVWGDDATTGELWILQLRKLWTSWQNQNLVVAPGHAGAEVSALAYSPSYKRDRTILVMASTGADVAPAYQNKTWLCLGERDASAGTTSWNSIAGYPLEIASTGDAPGVSRIYSSLALPSDYSSEEASSRQLFVSYDREPDGDDDVYRLDDTISRRMDAGGGNTIDISSISYYGTTISGRLLAGDANPVAGSLTVQVRRTCNPFDMSPSWDLATVPPTGPGNARVGWSSNGELAYCGTGQSPGVALDESAFSASLDGDEWRQLGLMDTIIKLADIAPAPDSESLFMTTCSAYGPEGIWRSIGDPLGRYWQRLLAMDTSSDAVILSLSADYESDDTIWVAEAGGELMAVSHDLGNTWQWRNALSAVIDIAVASEDAVYTALPDGYISKTTDSAWIWQEPVSTGLPQINMLAIAASETILVGGTDGDMAYSTDGGDTFIRIPEGLGDGDVQVAADACYEENGFVYAATSAPDAGIWRWRIGVSSSWEQIDRLITDLGQGQRIGGLAPGPEGTLYALRMEPSSPSTGGMTRSLNPLASDTTEIEFILVNDGLPAGATFDPTVVFPNTLPYLQLSGDAGQNDLWTIDTADQLIYRYQDTLCKHGPSLKTPEPAAVIPLGGCSCGYVTSLYLHWEGLSQTEMYQAAIYLDPDAAQMVWSGTSDEIYIMAVGGDSSAQLLTGIVYYWGVRATEPVNSPWSDMRLFTPALDNVWRSSLNSPLSVSPSPGAADVPLRPAFTWGSVSEADGYEFMLAADSQFAHAVVSKLDDNTLHATAWQCDRNLSCSTTYFWKVRAISANSYSEWVTNVFTTEAATSTLPTLQSPPTSSPPSGSTPLIPSHLLWAMVSIVVVLAAALLILIIRTRA